MSIFKRIKNFFTPDASRYAAKTAENVLKTVAKAKAPIAEPEAPKAVKPPLWRLLHASVLYWTTKDLKTGTLIPHRKGITFKAGRNTERRMARLSDAVRSAMLQSRRERQLAGAL